MGTRKLIHGVGVNDSDIPIVQHETINGSRKIVWRCHFYTRWAKMITRCYSPIFLLGNPTYDSCSVSEDWHLFSNFKKWMLQQDWQGKHLDKDIITVGNKIYSPDTCAFVSKDTNNFILDKSAYRGNGMVGVTKRGNKFLSRTIVNGVQINIGTYKTSEEAHEAWKKYKHELACKLADDQIDDRIAKALRVRYL